MEGGPGRVEDHPAAETDIEEADRFVGPIRTRAETVIPVEHVDVELQQARISASSTCPRPVRTGMKSNTIG